MVFNGKERIALILLFYRPDEFYVKLIESNELIVFSKYNERINIATKNEIVRGALFLIDHNSERVLCEILEDLKYDEIFCKVMLCNSNIVLKVEYLRLIDFRKLSVENVTNVVDVVCAKLYDFAPIFPSMDWNANLIEEMKNELTCSKYIVKFKSVTVDPVDGRYPVELLQISDRSSLNDKFLANETVSKESDYFKAALDREIHQIFSDHPHTKNPKIRYKISNPLAKHQPVPRPKISSPKNLNLKAEPYFPSGNTAQNEATEYSPLASLKSEAEIPVITPQKSASHLVDPQTVMFSEQFTSNAVNMFNEMFRNHQKSNQSRFFSVPFHDYKSVFPQYGGVNFSQIQEFRTNLLPPSFNLKQHQCSGNSILNNYCSPGPQNLSFSPIISDSVDNFHSSLPREMNTNELNVENVFKIADIPLPKDPPKQKEDVQQECSEKDHRLELTPEFQVESSLNANDTSQSAPDNDAECKEPLVTPFSNSEAVGIQKQSISPAISPGYQFPTGMFSSRFSSQNAFEPLVMFPDNYSRILNFGNLHPPPPPVVMVYPSFANYNANTSPGINVFGMFARNPLERIYDGNIFPFRQAVMVPAPNWLPFNTNTLTNTYENGNQEKKDRSQCIFVTQGNSIHHISSEIPSPAPLSQLIMDQEKDKPVNVMVNRAD